MELNTRIIQKNDTIQSWEEASDFIPLKGEIIIYNSDENQNVPKIKIGDGQTFVNNLPFVDDNTLYKIEQELTTEEIEQVRQNLKLDDYASKEYVSTEISEATKDVISVDGGGSLTLEDIFGEPPYTIEVTDEIEELYNVVVAPGTDYSTYRLRNVAIVTEIPTQMNDGDIALVIRREG